MANPTQSLAGKTIVVTRSRERRGPFVEMLRDRGAQVIEFPTIEIGPPENWTACDQAIASLTSFDVVIWTSANAVRRFCGRMAELGCPIEVFENVTTIAIGPATQKACEQFGLRALISDGEIQSEALARRLDFHDKNILFPRGDKALDRLPALLRARGNTVTEPVVYRTLKPTLRDGEKMPSGTRADAVTFFSPSSFENFVDGQKEILLHATVAAIGPTTAKCIRDAGYHVDVMAETPDIESLTAALESYFNKVTVS